MEKFEKTSNVERAAEETPQERISGAINKLEAMLDSQEVLDEQRVREQCDIVSEKTPFLYDADPWESLPIFMKCARLQDKLDRDIATSPSEIKLEDAAANKRAERLIELIIDRSISDISFGISTKLSRKENFIESLTSGQAALLFEAWSRTGFTGNFWRDLKLKKFFERNGTALSSIIEKSGTAEEKDTLTKVREIMTDDVVLKSLFSNLEESFAQEGEPMHEYRRDQAVEFLIENIEKYGISGKDVAQSWLSRTKRGERPPIWDNFMRMRVLEAARPGLTKFLYFERGIRNFERYKTNLLINQFEERDNKEKPYGIILNPLNDWNGAFSNGTGTWDRLHKQLKSLGYILRVVEAGGKLDAGKRLVRLDRAYGGAHKISFAFIGGHGTENSIQFGGPREIHSLHTKDLIGKGIKRSTRFFEENPTIVLVSCSTGAKAGIGEKLSEVMGAEVIAPDTPTNINDVKVSKEGNSLIFDVEYGKKESRQVFRRRSKI